MNFDKIKKAQAPSPTHYQNLDKKPPKPAFKPFNVSANRFKADDKDFMAPG